MKKCIAIILLISMTFSCRTDIVNGLENTKDLENKTNWKIPKKDVNKFLYILGTLGFVRLSIYLHHKFSTKKIDSKPELSNESILIDSSINVDSSEPETVQTAGFPSEPTQESVLDTDYINHIESANESVVSNAREAQVKNSSSKENNDIGQHHKFNTKKIDIEPELSNESTSIDSSISVDSSESETVHTAGSPSETTQEPVPDTNDINHIERANESVVSNAREAQVKNSSSKENKNIDQHILSEPTQEYLKYKKLYWQWLLCVYQIDMFFDNSIDISVLKTMFANCIAIIFDFENNKKVIKSKELPNIRTDNLPEKTEFITKEILRSSETDLNKFRKECVEGLTEILAKYFGLQSDNQVYRNEEQINHMIKFVEHNTAHEYLAKCERLQDPLKFKRSQDSEPEYIKTGKLVQYNFSPQVY